jgi:hypothetical protein
LSPGGDENAQVGGRKAVRCRRRLVLLLPRAGPYQREVFTLHVRANDAGVGLFAITQQARFVDVLGGKAKSVGCGLESILARNTFRTARGDLSLLLRGVIFIGEPALGPGLDLQRIGLRMVDRCNQLIVRILASASRPAFFALS